ncbi:lipase family protein [Nocardia sp. NPDC057227]|uniref:lipase family protein n=1 Tax=Nocardia sp. NPDC057227 TaxID=3346056 RepID=UPI003625017B
MPVLIIQAVNDELVTVADVDRLVDRYRRAGANIHYLRDRLSLHLTLLYLGTPATMDWIADRFDGAELRPGVTRTVWSLAATKRAARGHLRHAALLARMVRGLPITPRHARRTVDSIGVPTLRRARQA